MLETDMLGAIPVIIIIAREFIVTGLRTVAVSSGRVIAAAASGKLKTALQLVMLLYLMLMQELFAMFAWLDVLGQCLVWLTAAVTVYSGVEYLVKNRDIIDYKK